MVGGPPVHPPLTRRGAHATRPSDQRATLTSVHPVLLGASLAAPASCPHHTLIMPAPCPHHALIVPTAPSPGEHAKGEPRHVQVGVHNKRLWRPDGTADAKGAHARAQNHEPRTRTHGAHAYRAPACAHAVRVRMPCVRTVHAGSGACAHSLIGCVRALAASDRGRTMDTLTVWGRTWTR